MYKWISLLLMVVFPLTLESDGLRVEPGELLIQNVPPGMVFAISKERGIMLNVINQGDQIVSYTVRSARPSEAGTGKWLKGYSEIPDPQWVWFDKSELKIPPNDTASVELYLEIPEDERYYNQHWAVTLAIEGERESETERPLAVTLALYPQIYIETESKKETTSMPYGDMALVPSIIPFGDVELGMSYEIEVTLYNNDTLSHSYRTYPYTPPSPEELGYRQQIAPSPGYSWIPDRSWIRVNPKKILFFDITRSLEVPARDSRKFKIQFKIPKDEKYLGKNWETLVFIESEGGISSFSRLRVTTKK